ncbi:hypothetical protein GINT2_000655 [Glugoides intestinalis]
MQADSMDKIHATTLLQAIFDEMKLQTPKFTQLIAQIKNSSEYIYILKLLFKWTSKNKLFVHFATFFEESIIHFHVSYNTIKDIISAVFKKFKKQDLIKALSQVVQEDEIQGFIDDFPYLQVIVDGIAKRADYCNIIQTLLSSLSSKHVIVGTKLFSTLKTPCFNINHLINFPCDDVAFEAVKQLPENSEEYTEALLQILFSRGKTDEFAAEICKKLKKDLIAAENMQRIYSLFYLNPLNFVKYEIYEHGFPLDEHISTDLIKCLCTVFSEETFSKVTGILKSFEFTQTCYEQMVISLENSNYLFKCWVFSNIDTKNISLPFFIKVCWFVSNEDNLQIVEKALNALKNGKVYDLIDSWAKIKKLERLTRRVYPLKHTDRGYYKQIFERIINEEEKDMLNRVYNLSENI